jgi:glycosyltransferase involved in cell wall biosynthesis
VIRVAFTLIGGKSWTGGYNYLLNLLRVLSDHASGRVQPVLYVGDDVGDESPSAFMALPGVEVVRSPDLKGVLAEKRLRQAVLSGIDRSAVGEFEKHDTDVIFEAAQFYGWRLRIPAIAWVPDFQHRYLRELFGFRSYWRRELGFRAQVWSGRHVMLSSEDARRDCEHFYPATRRRTHVVRFAIEPSDVRLAQSRAIADQYHLPETFFFLPNQFWVHKNHECVVEALRLLSAKGGRIVVAASGLQADLRRPDHFPRLQAQIRDAGLERSFLLLGLIPHDHVLALMRSCAALINPSAFEGWSTTVEEAKAMGTPMILSSLNVHREQAEDQALYFDKDSPEQLALALETFRPLRSSEREHLAQESRRRAADAVQRFAGEFCELVEFVARSRHSSKPNVLPGRIGS